MKPSFLLFLKTFTFMGLSYAGMQMLIYYFAGSGDPRFSQSLISGVGFGLMLGIFHTYKQVREVKKLKGRDFTSEDLAVHQVAHFQSPLSRAEILAKLQNHYPAKDWKLQENGSEIKLKTTYSWKSFGEKIQIKTGQLQNGFTEILVESKPRGWVTIADYGKNLENITYLRNLLSA